MNREDLLGRLSDRAPGRWELYEKSSASWELGTSRAMRRTAWRREEGWAARWWEGGGPRFAAASSPEELARALSETARIPLAPEAPPEWPSGAAALAPGAPPDPPPNLFDELARAVAAASRGEALLTALELRRGVAAERISNAAGLDVAQAHRLYDGVAAAIARRGNRAREVRLPFRWDEASEIDSLARRLSDAATLPLSDRPAPFDHGQWLLDPPVAAALLAALSPLFAYERPPRWIGRGRLASPGVSIADDASADSPFDGEGVPTRRMLLVEDGALVGRLHDLRSARRAGARSTGHGARPSFRSPPRLTPRRIFFATKSPAGAADLLAAVKRGLFASALTAPVRVDLALDRYEVEFTGVSIVAGRGEAPVGGARATGRVSDLLSRIAGLSTNLQFFPAPFLAGSPTLLVERASFE